VNDRTNDGLLPHLRGALAGDGAGRTDAQLLGSFIEQRDDAAFAALVKRHGPMVWGVCRRLLPPHDAEDAFQATFLVLVCKAMSVVPRERVSNWLYGVARQTALYARRTAVRRNRREKQVANLPERGVAEDDLWRDLPPLFDEELSRLPDKFRTVIVLCDLEGKTRKEAARQLGLRDGSVASRLARARAKLAKQLTRRGVELSGGSLAALLTLNQASPAMPYPVAQCTIKAAATLTAGQTAGMAVIPSRVAALMKGVLKLMLLSKIKAVSPLLLVVLACVGGGLVAVLPLAAEPPPAAGKNDKSENKGPASRQGPEARNILRNSGFEEGDKSPDHWSQGAEIDGVEYIWDRKIGRKGTSSLCLRKTANRYFPIAQWYQVVDRTGNQSALKVAAQVKAEGVTKAILDVVFLDGDGEMIGHKWAAYIGAKGANDKPVSHDWKEYSGQVEIPAKAKKLLVGLQIYGPGKVWFDEVNAEYEK
jgi:RNA polymerase sigma-70 factor (ECF subfamily)